MHPRHQGRCRTWWAKANRTLSRILPSQLGHVLLFALETSTSATRQHDVRRPISRCTPASWQVAYCFDELTCRWLRLGEDNGHRRSLPHHSQWHMCADQSRIIGLTSPAAAAPDARAVFPHRTGRVAGCDHRGVHDETCARSITRAMRDFPISVRNRQASPAHLGNRRAFGLYPPSPDGSRTPPLHGHPSARTRYRLSSGIVRRHLPAAVPLVCLLKCHPRSRLMARPHEASFRIG
jgi:hypothetical protein